MNKIKKEGRTPMFTTDLKIAICRDYLTSSLGYGKLAVKYNLKSVSTVRSMVKWYRAKFPDTVETASTDVTERPVVVASLVDQALKEANLKVMALELLIANINKEVGFDVIKKFGTKQSPK